MHKFKLGPYKNLKLPPILFFTEDELNLGVMEAAKKLTGQWAKKHKPAEFGDEVIIDIYAECDNLIVPELSKSNYKFTLGDPSVLEPFNKINHKTGDDLVIAVPITAGFSIERVSGKMVSFNVTVQEVIPKHPIELTDEIARQIDPEVSGTDELKGKLRKIINENWQQTIWEKRIQFILDTIKAGSNYELDHEEFQKFFDNIYATAQSNLFSSNSPQILENLLSGNDELLYQKSKMLAEKAIVESLIINEIARLEDITIDKREFQEAKHNFLEFTGDEQGFNKLFPSHESFLQYLLKEKVLDSLLEWNDNENIIHYTVG